jgi:hypothetical protein
MLPNALKEKVLLRHKTRAQTSSGVTEAIIPVAYHYASVTPLSVQAIAQYQQLNSVVSHQVVMRGYITLNLGDYDFLWGSKTLTPAQPPKYIKGMTVVVVKEG